MPTDVLSATPSPALLDRVSGAGPASDLGTLRRDLLDQADRSGERRRDCDRAAHMMLYLDEPAQLLALGLDHLADTLSCERADAGVLDEADTTYRPTAVIADGDAQRAAIAGTPLPNRHDVLRAVWRSSQPVTFSSVRGNRHLGSLEPVFVGLGTEAMLATPIRHRGVGLGLLCLDETESRTFTDEERRWVDRFVTTQLAPLLAASLHRLAARSTHLSAAESDAVALLAEGLSYTEIARRLDKSPRTVDNQLRSARRKAGARNAVELVRWWQDAAR